MKLRVDQSRAQTVQVTERRLDGQQDGEDGDHDEAGWSMQAAGTSPSRHRDAASSRVYRAQEGQDRYAARPIFFGHYANREFARILH